MHSFVFIVLLLMLVTEKQKGVSSIYVTKNKIPSVVKYRRSILVKYLLTFGNMNFMLGFLP